MIKVYYIYLEKCHNETTCIINICQPKKGKFKNMNGGVTYLMVTVPRKLQHTQQKENNL